MATGQLDAHEGAVTSDAHHTSKGHWDSHGSGNDSHGSHGTDNPGMEWLVFHMGGIITAFGKRFEKVMEAVMMPAVSGFFTKAAVGCLVLFTPVLLLEFVLQFVGR